MHGSRNPHDARTPLDSFKYETGNKVLSITAKSGATLSMSAFTTVDPVTLKQLASIYVLSFVEGGAAYDSFRNYNPFDIKRSAGAGIRIFMPAFGLLGIDFGYGFDPVLNGFEKNGWETHFIIGQQF